MNKNEKMWNGNKYRAKPDISIYGRKKVIHIGKDILRLLGGPEFICIRINKEMDSLVISPCGSKELISFKVPQDIMFNSDRMMRVSSRSFVSGILTMNNMSDRVTYKITGIYLEKDNAVAFRISDARVHGEEEKQNKK